MFNLGPAEVLFILVVALVVLGPTRLPEMARGLGKFFYEFKRQTDEVRGMVEREFYKMDDQVRLQPRPPPEGAVAARRFVSPPNAEQLPLPPGETIEGQGPAPIVALPPSVTPVETAVRVDAPSAGKTEAPEPSEPAKPS
jgi:sec-independent protein translocase protein TatB